MPSTISGQDGLVGRILHIRNYSPGGYTTVKEHLCSAHRHYMDRSPEYYLNKSKLKSETLYQLLEHLFAQNRHPEQLYRTCDGLLNLQRKTDPKIFDKACQIAINQQTYTYAVVLNIIKNKRGRLRYFNIIYINVRS